MGVEATVDAREGMHVLAVAVHVNSGGFDLHLDETRGEGERILVYLTLSSPGEDEIVTMALETKHATVALAEGRGPVHVYIKEKQRGQTYVQEPPYQLARIVTRS